MCKNISFNLIKVFIVKQSKVNLIVLTPYVIKYLLNRFRNQEMHSEKINLRNVTMSNIFQFQKNAIKV